MKHPLILEEIGRHSWACTDAAVDGILRAVESGLSAADEPIFHAALAEIRSDLGAMPDYANSSIESEYWHSERIGNVGVVRIEGPIVPYASVFTRASGLVSVETLGADFEAMASDASISRIVMVLDSPGGSATGISELATQIAEIQKPVVAYVYGMAASAAYWIASAADEIVSSNTGIVGSIGTVLTVAADGDGDGYVKIKSSQSPLKQADPETDEGRAHYQEIVDALADVFVETVAANRETTREDVLEHYGRGGMVAPDKALAAGMIDSVSTYRSFFSAFSSPDWKNSTEQSANRVDASESGGGTIDHKGAEIAPGERTESMNLNEFLAANPEARQEIDAVIAGAMTEHRERVSAAVKVATSEAYPSAIRNLAGQVLMGTAEPAALTGAMSVLEMEFEKKKSAEAVAASAELPETPAQKQETLSADGVIRSEADFKAAVERAKAMR